MPEISRFFGIIIAMFYNDHPPPHFHVRYGGALHRSELLDNWEQARTQSPLNRVEPLE